LIIILLTIIFLYGIFIIFNSGIDDHPIDNISTLYLSLENFPKGWRIGYIKPVTQDYDWGIESKSISFELESKKGGAHQYVYRFNRISTARQSENDIKERLVLIKENKYPYLEYQSKVASSWHFVCDRDLLDGPNCEVFARYDNFIIHLAIGAEKGALTPEELKTILQSMDNQMAEVLKSKPAPAWIFRLLETPD
jgi:hypothetical protein